MRVHDSRMVPTFDLEAAELALGSGPIVGIDEAGRGPWAGPVVAAAVILDPDRIPQGINDSKAMDENQREQLYDAILAHAVAAEVGIGSVERIDRDNILAATLWAMGEAVRKLSEKPKLAIIDGNRAPKLACETRTIVKGDAKCLSIAAASVVAKVTRDRMMRDLGALLPGYGFERHKGYGTAEHKAAIQQHGVTEHHRKSFRPVQLALSLASTG